MTDNCRRLGTESDCEPTCKTECVAADERSACEHPEASLRTTTEVVATKTVTTCSTCGSVRERLRMNAAQARAEIEASPEWMRTPPTEPRAWNKPFMPRAKR